MKLSAGLLPVFLTVLFAGITTAAWSGDAIVVNGNGVTKTYECADQQVVVNGNENTLTLSGKCRGVVINGNKNRIIANASIGNIILNGSKNTVKWSSSKNPERPTVVDNGSGNSITQEK